MGTSYLLFIAPIILHKFYIDQAGIAARKLVEASRRGTPIHTHHPALLFLALTCLDSPNAHF